MMVWIAWHVIMSSASALLLLCRSMEYVSYNGKWYLPSVLVISHLNNNLHILSHTLKDHTVSDPLSCLHSSPKYQGS